MKSGFAALLLLMVAISVQAQETTSALYREIQDAETKGIATPSTNPGTPTSYEKWDVYEVGTFTNFLDSSSDPIVIIQDDLDAGKVLLVYDTTLGYWQKIIIPINIVGLVQKASLVKVTGKNLLDISVAGSAGYITSAGGYTALAGAKTTDYIAVSATTQYTISGLKRSSLGKYIAYYDGSNVLISATSVASNGSGLITPFTFTPPARSHTHYPAPYPGGW